MTDIREELRRTVAQLAELTRRRDDLIREAIAAKVLVTAIADDARLSVPRIYQIRDGR